MKLVRFGDPGEERPGVWLEAGGPDGAPSILDVRAMAFDIEDFDGHFFERDGLLRIAGLLSEPSPKLIAAAGVRIGPPLPRPGKIICMGGNYAEHVRESKSQIPAEPVFFNKASSAVIGAFDDIVLPTGAISVDAEAELAVVIGTRARNVAKERAMSRVAGFMTLNDVSDRDAQRSRSQWFWGKSPDTFCPIGPWLVTPDEVGDCGRLAVTQTLNGVKLQDGNTAQMIFDIPFVIAYLSSRITLMPGDIISTGTPDGVGSARKPPVALKPGDIVEVEVEGVGRQRNRVAAL